MERWIERFWRRIDASGDCWDWTGPIARDGYGRCSIGDGRRRQTHRVAWQLLVGAIPDGYHVHHACGRRCCVNPDHLELVTNAEHAYRAGHCAGRRLAKTHCPKGHPYSGRNLYVHKGRHCRLCRAETMRAYEKTRPRRMR